MSLQKSFAHLLGLLLAVAAGVARPDVPAQLSRDSAPAVEARSDDQKRALAALDAAIVRFRALVDAVTDVQYKAVNNGFLEDFTTRGLALRKTYDPVAGHDLRLDLNIEYQRLVAWLVTQSRIMPVGNAERGSDLAVYFVRPAPANPVEVKASLEALDREIGRLPQRTNALPAGPNRIAEENRIKLIRERRAELEKGFTQDRWDALIGDLKKQWEHRASALKPASSPPAPAR